MGSSAPENNYIIDGLTTTDAVWGTSGTNLTFNFIEEVEIKTGGYEAEFGRSSGGIINVITKSGGNEFTGEMVYFFNTYDMNGSGNYKRYRGEDTEWIGNQYSDLGGEIGGYITKDKLWFCLAYNPSYNENKWLSIDGVERSGEWTTNHYAGKLTWNIHSNHRLVFSAFGDPRTYQGIWASLVERADESSFMITRKHGSNNYILKYTGTITDNFLVDASLGYRKQRHDLQPGSEAAAGIYRLYEWDDPAAHGYADHPEYVDGYAAGGWGPRNEQSYLRTVYDLKVTYFSGGHQVKAGINYEENSYETEWGHTGGIEYTYNNNSYSSIEGEGRQTNETLNTSFFIQDNWQLTDFLNVHFGLRYEIQDLLAADGSRAFQINDNWAPRIGFGWDILQNRKSKLFGSYSRFYESIPMSLTIDVFNYTNDIKYKWSYGDDNIPHTDDDYILKDNSEIGYSNTESDPHLKGQFLDEYVFGFDYEFMPNIALGIKFTYRELKQIIEDIMLEDGSYLICNPGEGSASHIDKPKREYTSLELTAQKKFSDNYQFNFSYVWSRLVGNYEGLTIVGTIWQHNQPLFDYPEMMINSDGYLPADRTHRFKFYGAYVFDFGLTLGSVLQLQSGRPINAYTALGLFYWEGEPFFSERRGYQGRTPWTWQADVHCEYTLKFWEKIDPTLMLDVFNITNNNETTGVDEMKYTERDSWYDPETGTFVDPNPYWKDPVMYQRPRLFRVGVRLRF